MEVQSSILSDHRVVENDGVFQKIYSTSETVKPDIDKEANMSNIMNEHEIDARNAEKLNIY